MLLSSTATCQYLPGLRQCCSSPLYASLYTACFAFGVAILRERGIQVFLSAPILWTLFEYLRSHLLTGFPWQNLAYSQYLYPSVIQIADITGIYGITFAIVMINAVFYDLWSARFRGRHRLVETVIACVMIAAILGYGHFRLERIDELLKDAPKMEVSLIQGNIDQNMKWDPLYQLQTVDIYRTLSRQVASSRGGLIVWPETAAPFYFQQHSAMQSEVVDIARTSGSALLFGSSSYEEEKVSIS